MLIFVIGLFRKIRKIVTIFKYQNENKRILKNTIESSQIALPHALILGM